MLSISNSTSDVLKYLEPNYQTYGFENEDYFHNSIDDALDEAKLRYIIPIIGENRYKELKALDKTFNSVLEEYIYQAEINFALSLFLYHIGQRITQIKKDASSITISQNGISKSMSGENGFLESSKAYLKQAYRYIELAGYSQTVDISNAGSYTYWERNF